MYMTRTTDSLPETRHLATAVHGPVSTAVHRDREVQAVNEPSDLLNIDSLFSLEELAMRDKVRSFVDSAIRPNIATWYEQAVFPVEIIKEMAGLGLLGMHLKGYGCPGRSAVEYGLAAHGTRGGRFRLRTFVSVQGSLAMSAISQAWLRGTEAGVAAPDGRRRGRSAASA